METTAEKMKRLGKKSWDWLSKTVRHGSIKLALFLSTMIGNGSPSTAATMIGTNDNTNAPQNPIELSETPGQNKANAADCNAATEKFEELLAEHLVSQNQNLIGNFDVEGRSFTPEELQMIQQSDLSKEIQSIAKKKANPGAPKKGQQTYCLGAVKNVYATKGITIDAQRFAYRAVDGFKKNEHFVEIDTNMENFHSLPDATVIAWEKGTTRYGHVAMKIGNKEYCDFIYNLRTHNRRGSSGQRYGKAHAYILKDMPIDKKLAKKLIAEGRLKEPLKKQTLAMVKIGKMKMLLNVKDLAQINEDFRQADVPEIKLQPQPLAMGKKQQKMMARMLQRD